MRIILEEANKTCHVSAIQNKYSLMARGYEHIFKVCEELGVTYVAFSPLANGFLSGKEAKIEKEGDYRNFMLQYAKKGYERGEELLKLLKNLAQKHNATMAQISLAWMINKHPNLVAIPGSKNIDRIKENFDSQNIVLTKDELKEIDEMLGRSSFIVFGQ